MEDTKIKDEDLALLNSLRGKWLVFPPAVCHRRELPVVITDTAEEAKATRQAYKEWVPGNWEYWAEPVERIIADRLGTEGLIDRLRELVNERGMVREEVGGGGGVTARAVSD
jgi:hypothetical protein